MVHDAHAWSGWETAILMIPIACLMVLTLFGQDELLARRRSRRVRSRRHFCELSGEGGLQMSDPDGLRWEMPGKRVAVPIEGVVRLVRQARKGAAPGADRLRPKSVQVRKMAS